MRKLVMCLTLVFAPTLPALGALPPHYREAGWAGPREFKAVPEPFGC